MPTSRLSIDLGAVERNLSVVRSVIGDRGVGGQTPGVCAVVKQDGYGIGAIRVAKRLAASGVRMLAVYTLDEARALADAVPALRILVLMPVHGVDRMDPLYRHAATGRLHLTVHDLDQLAAVTDMSARLGISVPVHVQIDTGISRGGIRPGEAEDVVRRVAAAARLRLAGVMTHFSSPCCDGEFTRMQHEMFTRLIGSMRSNLGDAVVHSSNTCATFRSRAYHDGMVRVGQCLYGYCLENAESASDFEFADAMRRLGPASTWTSTIAHITEIPEGWPVGYGSTFKAPARPDGRPTRIALIPVGYADGYPRALGNKGVVGFTGRRWERRGGAESDAEGRLALGPTVFAPVVGRVSMDQITVDVTDVPESHLLPARGTDLPGSEVELYGRERNAPNFLPTLAAAAGTITHELLCRVGPRVERVYRYPAAVESSAPAEPVLRFPGDSAGQPGPALAV